MGFEMSSGSAGPGVGSVGREKPDASTGAFVVAVVGDSGSGKDTVADAVAALLGTGRITDVRLDDYRRYTREERLERKLTALGPELHDLGAMEEDLWLLRSGQPIQTRSYRHRDGTFGPVRIIEAHELVMVRGSLVLANEALAGLYDLSIFLRPEPDLLFRWKLRRDVLFRGYSQAEVLKHIASHVLDAKEYVLPQAERADVVVEYRLPDWEAPDNALVTHIRLRRAAAAAVRDTALHGSLPVEQTADGDDVVLTVPATISLDEVDALGREAFPGSYSPDRVGSYWGEDGELRRRASLALLEVMLARLVEVLRAG